MGCAGSRLGGGHGGRSGASNELAADAASAETPPPPVPAASDDDEYTSADDDPLFWVVDASGVTRTLSSGDGYSPEAPFVPVNFAVKSARRADEDEPPWTRRTRRAWRAEGALSPLERERREIALEHAPTMQRALASGAADAAADLPAAAMVRPGPGLGAEHWEASSGDALVLRGKTYLQDRVKVRAEQPPLFACRRVDVVELPEATPHIAARSDNAVHTCWPESFVIVVQLMVPGPPHRAVVLYFVSQPNVFREGILGREDEPVARLFAAFLAADAETADSMLKLIPRVVDGGGWLVRRAVGTTPCLLGRKVRQDYHRAKRYLEVDVHLESSTVAKRALGVVLPVARQLTVELAFLLEGRTADELPERLLGCVQLKNVDLSRAVRLQPCEHALPTLRAGA